MGANITKMGANANIICRKCGKRLIEISNERGVQYWKNLINKSNGRKLIGGFIDTGRYAIRISYHSPAVAEVWGNEFPLEKQHWIHDCPYCQEEMLKDIKSRKEKKRKERNKQL